MKDITITIPADALRTLLAKLDISDANTSLPAGTKSDVRLGTVPDDHPGQDWSDKQKRLIYRICYERGFTGEDAKRYIRKQVGLTNGRPPSMREASALIDELTNPDNTGGRHGAP